MRIRAFSLICESEVRILASLEMKNNFVKVVFKFFFNFYSRISLMKDDPLIKELFTNKIPSKVLKTLWFWRCSETLWINLAKCNFEKKHDSVLELRILHFEKKHDSVLESRISHFI